MASYNPSVSLKVVKSCGESWESMPGDARTRHCARCDRDVINLATMTPRQIDALLAKPGPLPCMRAVTLQDGSLLAAEEIRAPRFPKLLAAAACSLAAISSASVSATASAQDSRPSAQAALSGKIVDRSGLPIPGAHVFLNKNGDHRYAVTADSNGNFVVGVPSTGRYFLSVEATGFRSPDAQVTLHKGGQQLKKPFIMDVGVFVLGEMIAVKLPTKGAKVMAPVSSEAKSE